MTVCTSVILSRFTVKMMLCCLSASICPAAGLAVIQVWLPKSRLQSVLVLPLFWIFTESSVCVVPKFNVEGVICISASCFTAISCMSALETCPGTTVTLFVLVSYPSFINWILYSPASSFGKLNFPSLPVLVLAPLGRMLTCTPLKGCVPLAASVTTPTMSPCVISSSSVHDDSDNAPRISQNKKMIFFMLTMFLIDR